MAVKSSGALSFSEIAAEFGDSKPHKLSEFYRGGSLVPDASANSAIATSGAITFNAFYGAVNEIIKTVTATTTNIDAATLFGSNWGANVPKRLVINSGVTVGSTSVGAYALHCGTGMGGTLIIDNYGSIQGAGGAANSGGGGHAIRAASSGISINNQGSIYAGGGGGGKGGTGGTGGQGYYTTTTTEGPYYSQNYPAYFWKEDSVGSVSGLMWNSSYVNNDGSYTRGAFVTSSTNAYGQTENYYKISKTTSTTHYTDGGAGGAGGSGGRGQGYGQSYTGGSAGSAGAYGGTNAGRGGTGGSGGTGGDWGNSGAGGGTGATGQNGNYTNGSAGSSGQGAGQPGYYVYGNGNVTWINNGSRLGRVA